MSIVKSFSVGYGDTFYIRHNTDNFTIIDCCLTDENKEQIIAELKRESDSKGIRRFISTHPDEDHYRGIEYLDRRIPILNFYCVQNKAAKEDETDSFTHYCSLRDGSQAYYVSKGCTRRWMNLSDNEREHAGIHVLWPNTSNAYFKAALRDAEDGIAFNNISLVAKYCAGNNARMLWLGDLETAFMESIEYDISLAPVHIIFAPHHGRASGKIPDSWLDKLKPKIIVIGEAPSRHLHYYGGYKLLTQNRAGDLTFDCDNTNKIDIYSSSPTYSVDFLEYEYHGYGYSGYYLGTLNF
jgi:beta-lactamase superfamily II metal-dependent hydrolase